MKKTFLKIGHRGNGAGYNENTMLSIHLSSLAEADGFEYDVRETKDHKIVLMHDETIDRTTNGTGKVSDYDYDKLQKFNAGYQDCIPLLEEVFQQFDYRFHNIELKEDVGKEVLRLVTKYGMADRVIVSSFKWNDLAPFLGTKIPVALLADADKVRDFGDYGIITEAVHRSAAAINPHFSAITPSLVALAHKHELKVYVWTVNEPADIARMKRYGVDGIISDYPERL